MLTPAEAWERLALHAGPLSPIEVPREEARGRVLAADLLATVDVPSLDVSAMDGYALGGDPPPESALLVQTSVAAGDAPGTTLETGKAIHIMTGAPIPAGADRVVPVEATKTDDGGVCFLESSAAGDHIRRRGEVLRSGEVALAAGERISAGAAALIAAHGYSNVPVVRTPSVAFLTTGNEVVPPEETPEPGQLRDTHSDFLRAAAAELGLELRALGIAPDDRDALRDALRPALTADVLLVSGGVSAGAYDFVEQALQELGCQRLFKGVAMQPGKPLLAARHGHGLVFGLPGNPGSVQVCYWLFVRPVLRRMMGFADGYWHGALRARLAGELPGGQGRDRFVPAIATVRDGIVSAQPLRARGSHDLRAFARAAVLIHTPAELGPRQPGDECEVLRIA